MKNILKIISYIALAFVIIAPCMFFVDIITQNMMEHIMFTTAVVWFVGMMLANSKWLNKTS